MKFLFPVWFSFRVRFSVLVLLCLCVSRVACGDSIVYDNGVGGPAGIDDASSSDTDLSSLTADDFVLASNEFVTEVLWSGVYAIDNIPSLTDDFTIDFYDDSGSSPGSLLASFSVGDNVNRTDSGVDLVSLFDIYDYSATISGISLSAGQTYWVSIYADTFAESDDFYWGIQNGAGNSQANDTGSWAAANHRADFRLGAVPEPSLIGLFGGLACLAVSRRIRS